MNIQAFKRWHWMVIGLVAGAILAVAKMMAVSDQMMGGPAFVSQAMFENSLYMTDFEGGPAVTDIVIRPRDNVDLVRFEQFNPVVRSSGTYYFAARRPYTRLGAAAPPSADYRIADFLGEVATRNPKISFQYAWWEKPPTMITIYALVGAAIIGGVWPVLLRLMVGAGLGRPEPEYDLDRFKSEPQPQKQDSELTDEERRHFAELEAEMMAGLGQGESDVPQDGAGQSAAGGVKVLTAEEVVALPRAVGEDKSYAGQFYPVEKKVPHGFTIVELLVVIGIILLLVAILLPVLSHARERAQAVKCASNLRQVGQGLEMYNQVHKQLPLDGKPASLAAAMDEMNVGGVMVCPSDPTGTPSYSMNAAFAGLPKSAGNPTDVLGSESGNRHTAGPNVLYFDGHVEEKAQ